MKNCIFTLFLALIIISLGCSSGMDNPVSTPESAIRQTSESSHMLWGLWQFSADIDKGTLDCYQLRTPEMHLNALPFLEPPALVNLTLESLEFNGNIIEADIGLRHPFLGLDEFTGFDVCGVFITNGSVSGFSDPDLRTTGPGDTRLLNPDGLTRWWNPAEFPTTGTMFGYGDGILGSPDSIANFNSTLNAYKFFCDDLADPDSPVSDVDIESRCVFSAGQKNVRHYTIEIGGDGLVFNYAIDANWRLPNGPAPWDIPDDFDPDANRCEAWNVSVTEIDNSLWNDGVDNGGNLHLLIDVWDHFDADLNTVYIESPGNFDPFGPVTPTDGGVGYSAYDVEIIDATPAAGSIDILVICESEAIGYQDMLPGEPICAYFLYTADVSNGSGVPPTALMEATSATSIDEGGSVSFDATASTGTPPLTFTWDFNDDDTYGGPEDDYTGNADTPTHQFDDAGTFNVTVKVTNDYGEDISDAVSVQVGYDADDIFVDADFPGDFNDGSMEFPFITIQEGMTAVTTGHKVHVDYYDGGDNIYDTNGLTLKSNVILIGDNWNGGGPGKPKTKNNNEVHTIGSGSSLSNFTLDGFEIGLGEMSGSSSNYGVRFSGSSNDNITVRHCHITGTVDDTGKTSGTGIPIQLSNCDNSLVELNEVGPITWESETGGVYARVLWGIHISTCDNIEVKNNFIHDITIDYDGDTSWGQIRMFCLHCYMCNDIDVNNNLICHIEGVNDYDYRIEGMMIEGYSTNSDYHYYNNTIDNLDHSQSNGGFSLRGIFIYSSNAPGTYINNTLMTNFYTGGSSSIQAYFSSPSYLYDVSYSTGYNLGSITDYFYNLVEGDGVVNYPGLDPQYVNNTTSPYDYTFTSGSGCEMGDPNFLDWNDTGTASGNPNEPNEQNRSRMGCFGGPDGDWDPNDL